MDALVYETECVPDTTKSTGRPKKGQKAKDKSGMNTNSKRIKIQRACDACRKRKPPTKRGPPKQYIELLEARLQLVEKALRTIDGPARRILDDAFAQEPMQELAERTIEEMGVSVAAPYPGTAMVDRFTVNEIGQALYVNDMKERVDRIPSMPTEKSNHSPHTKYAGHTFNDSHSDAGSTAGSTASSSAASPAITQGSMSSCGQRNPGLDLDIVPPEAYVSVQQSLGDIPLALVEVYFDHVHTYAPMIHKPYFYKKLVSKTDCPSKLLLYAMCAVASRWAPAQTHQQSPGAPPGFFFYQRAFALIDEHSDAPRVSTVQALVLLTKYQEHYRRAGFFCRPGLFLSMATKMANDLGLSKVDSLQGDPHEVETKKRTFWVAFMYDLMTSIEEGREPYFANTQCTTDYPQATAEEGPTLEELLTNHNSVIQLGKILSEIYAMSRRVASRQQLQSNTRSVSQVIEEHARLFVLHTHLETFVHELPATLSYLPTQYSANYPAEKQPVPDVFIGFLHMTYHFSMILLHRHYVLHPFPEINIPLNAFPHRELCASSASNITNITETLLETMPMEIFSYPTRGVQLTIHCAATAATIHAYEKTIHESSECAKIQYLKTLTVLHRLASESPAVEFHSLVRETELSQLYGQMAVDPVHLLYSQSSAASIASSTSPSVPYSNDPSSTSSSPVLSAIDARGRMARHHTLTGPNNKPGKPQRSSYTTEGNVGQSVVFNTSPSALVDPSRFNAPYSNPPYSTAHATHVGHVGHVGHATHAGAGAGASTGANAGAGASTGANAESKLMTSQNPMMSAPDHSHMMLDALSVVPDQDGDEAMDLTFAEQHLAWPMTAFEDIQRNEGHVMQ
ncbi:fungal-specific transcription factor domain-containing protein [Spinellus fusiger]|nr:fungal-specific transcription factor domain-containing protein [Spinellus fusiger]